MKFVLNIYVSELGGEISRKFKNSFNEATIYTLCNTLNINFFELNGEETKNLVIKTSKNKFPYSEIICSKGRVTKTGFTDLTSYYKWIEKSVAELKNAV